VDAWHSYSRGRHFWNSRGADNLRKSVSYFDSAIARDPGFARAHAARAIAYALLPEYTDEAPPNASDLTYSAADRALALDPNIAEAYTAIGLASLHDWKYSDAEAAYKKAIQLDPRYATAHQWYGELLYHTGRIDEAIASIRTSGEIDLLSPIHPAALGYALYLKQDYAEALAVVRKGIEIAPTLGLHHSIVGNILMMMGKHREALGSLRTAARLEPELAFRQGYLAHALARSGDAAGARAIVEKLRMRRPDGRQSYVALAIAYLGLGENENALTAMEEAVEAHDITLVTSASVVPDPIYNPLRSDPRFREIIRKMNLDPYASRR
jgi:serine/threonine-protein kinase